MTRMLVVIFMLLTAAPVAAQSSLLSKATDIALGLHVAGQAADTVLTLHGLDSGRVYEANPLVRPLVTRPALFVAAKAAITVVATVALYKMKRRHPRAVAAAAFALAALYTAAAAWNLKELSK